MDAPGASKRPQPLDVEMTDEDILTVLKNVDIDGSGKIEFDEFVTMVEASLNQKGVF